MKEITIGIYDIKVYLYFGLSMKKLLKLFKKQHPSYEKEYNVNLEDYRNSEGVCVPMGSSFAVLIEEISDDIKQIKVVAHECTHCAIGVFNTISTEIDPFNQEPFVYLVDYLVGEVLEFIKGKKSSHKN